MTGTGFDSGASGPAPSTSGGGHGSGWWARRPRRSRNDRMVAGVAGGLARMLRVDPILIRIAFVVLALFGGSGILLYALGWLLLASDDDQVSPGEALLGRGRSSTSPVVAVGLGIVVVVGLMSTFSWGLPFFPTLVIALVIGVLMMRHRGRNWTPEQQQSFMDRVDRSVQNLSDRASRIGSNWSEHPSGLGDVTGATAPGRTRPIGRLPMGPVPIPPGLIRPSPICPFPICPRRMRPEGSTPPRRPVLRASLATPPTNRAPLRRRGTPWASLRSPGTCPSRPR